MKKIELLAPAGNIDSFKAACSAGADAIYMGLPKFNARTMAKNFDNQSYIECINDAHKRGIKVFLTLNTLMYDDEMKEALELAIEMYSHGLDAVIVQDIGLAMLLHEIIPDLPLHASTQMSVYSIGQVKYLESLGFRRVVLARELSIDEIKDICDNTNVEIEVFVHGALCVCVSGQCMLSSVIGDRSANRGSCAQPCRMKYSLYTDDSKKIKDDTYILSKKDIFGLGYIDKLVKAGVTSLKIEGRNRTQEYTAGVVSKYREYIDRYYSNKDITVKKEDKDTLMQLFNRNGESTGYLDGVKSKESITLLSPKNTGLLLGKIIDKKDRYIKVKLLQDIDLHDGIEIYGDDIVSTIVTCIKDDHFNLINKEIKKDNTVWLGDVRNVSVGDNIYKTSSSSLNQKYKELALSNCNKKEHDIEINILKDSKITAEIKDKNIITTLDYIPQVAISKATNIENVQNAFSKTIDTPYIFNIKLNIDDNLFVPASLLNELRREVVNTLDNSYNININVEEKLKNLYKILDKFIVNNSDSNENKYTSLYIYRFNIKKNYAKEYKIDHKVNLDRIYININDYIKYDSIIMQKYANQDIYLYIPNVIFGNMNKYIMENIERLLKENIKGFLIGSYEYLKQLQELKQKYEFEIIGDYSLNATNKYSASFLKRQGIDTLCLSFECKEADSIKKIMPVEVIDNYITVMTSRYCILGSFVNNSEKCNSVCKKNNYYIKDTFGKKYDIVCDNSSCIMKLVTNINSNKSNINIRNSIIE